MRKRKQVIIYKSWDDLPLILGLAEVSILTGLGTERIRQLCVAGEIPAFQIGKQWKVEKDDLKKWFDSRKTVHIGA